MNEAPHNFFMLISDSQVSISSVTAVWQEWFGLNPDCFWQNKPSTRKCFITCSLICFSDGFDKKGRIEMGLKFEGSDLSPDLKRGITFASLNIWGKVFLSIQRLCVYYRLEFQQWKVLRDAVFSRLNHQCLLCLIALNNIKIYSLPWLS